MFFKYGDGFAIIRSLNQGMKTSIVILIMVVGLFSYTVSAAEHLNEPLIIKAQPAQCVALHQGRECFATISLNWQPILLGHYCLYQKETLVKCWENNTSSIISFNFQSSETKRYSIIDQRNKNVVAQTTIEVSWVHKATPRKRRWRLF